MQTIFEDGFEREFEDFDGIKELTVPPGWTPDWLYPPEHIPGVYHRPEYYPKDAQAGQASADQVHSGRFSATIENVSSTQNACLYKTITEGVKKGDLVRVQVWGASVVDNVDQPGLIGGHGMRVGIDPTGGTKFDGLSVRYGEWHGTDEPDYKLGQYVAIYADAVAEADQITIFLHTFCKNPYRTIASIWDDVLVQVGEKDEFPEEEPFEPLGPEHIEADTEVFRLTLERLEDLIQLKIEQAKNA